MHLCATNKWVKQPKPFFLLMHLYKCPEMACAWVESSPVHQLIPSEEIG